MRRARSIVVVGNGMAGSRLAEELRHREPDPNLLRITIFGDEPHPAYNRVLLSTVVAGKLNADQTHLRDDGWWERHGITVRVGERVVAVDPAARTVHTDRGAARAYHELVLATGSRPFVPALRGFRDDDGALAAGVHVFRTLDDCVAISAAAGRHARVVVLGGGLLGLETARGLALRGNRVTVVHNKAYPMERQLDGDAGAVLGRVVENLDVALRLGSRACGYRSEPERALLLDDGSELPCDLVVISAGVVADTDLGSSAGVAVDRGYVVDDLLRTTVPHISAIGECAQHRGITYGLVQPGWEQAAVVANRLTGADEPAGYTGTPDVTRLKAPGIDLASMGSVHVDMHDRDHTVTTFVEPATGRYAKLIERDGRVTGAVLLGCPEVVGTVTQLFDAGLPVPSDRLSLLTGRGPAPVVAADPTSLPAAAMICRCNSVTKGALTNAWRDGHRTTDTLADATHATTGCGGCRTAVEGICDWLHRVDPQVDPDADPGRHLSAIAG